MRKSASTLPPFFPVIAALACLAAGPACAQSYTFTSDGTGTYFTDTLTTGRPHAVDFFSRTSGQSAGKDSVLTITGYGDAGVTYTNTRQVYYEDADLTAVTILLGDVASRFTLFSATGFLHYQFITSPSGTNTLSLTGTGFDAGGTPWHLDFFKDRGAGTVTTELIQPVPEPAPATDLGLMLGLTLVMAVWTVRKRQAIQVKP